MVDKMDEKVAVLPRALFQDFDFPGIVSTTQAMNQLYLFMQQVEFKRRGNVEENESWLQVIPYMYIYEKSKDSVFVYRRSKLSGEARLHGEYSIGIGGHINEKDCFASTLALLGIAACRELHEEVVFEPPMPADGPDMLPVGVMLLDTAPVDRVHLGVVIRVNYSGIIRPNGDEIEVYGWESVNNLKYLELENWSKAVAEFIIK